jgi:Rps23 Pro-64 3,4-dihydroxylase Tpa1-like proline 4-hydroxylase
MLIENCLEVYDGIFVVDNFYEKYIDLKNIINKNSDQHIYHEGDFAHNYSWIDKGDEYNNISSEGLIVEKYCTFLKSCVDSIFLTNVKKRNGLNAIIYPAGGRKGAHTDSFHKDEEGNLHEIHIFSSVHFLEEPESGGELYYPDFDLKIESKENRAVFFKAKYLHEVLEITSGIKISINYFWEVH